MEILVVDDDKQSLAAVADFLRELIGHQVTTCHDGEEALQAFEQHPCPMVLSDIRMPKLSGLELLKKIKESPHGKKSDVILMTGYADMNSVIQALRGGAYDYLLKPINVEELAAVTERVAEHQALLQENHELTSRFEEKVTLATDETESKLRFCQQTLFDVAGIGEIGFFSNAMKELKVLAERFHQDRTIPVLIEGETGTGKEVIAQLIHFGLGDQSSIFVSVNCSAIAHSLFESEIFGYEGGAFTGAKKEGMRGKLELAQKGTIFLDEIGDLPLEFQPKLLRVLQERSLYRVGGVKKIKLDIRIICATNHNLQQQVREGKFRKDLYYRLNTGNMTIPPLRKRTSEIAPLAKMFLKQFSLRKKSKFKSIGKPAIKMLKSYNWPGNVRELQNTIERVVLLYDDVEVKTEYLSFLDTEIENSPEQKEKYFDLQSMVLPPEKLDLQHLDAMVVKKALEKFNGNKTKTSIYLGLTRSALRSRMKGL